jgi:hypothetical protein
VKSETLSASAPGVDYTAGKIAEMKVADGPEAPWVGLDLINLKECLRPITPAY